MKYRNQYPNVQRVKRGQLASVYSFEIESFVIVGNFALLKPSLPP
jgi:hypothetical protein